MNLKQKLFLFLFITFLPLHAQTITSISSLADSIQTLMLNGKVSDDLRMILINEYIKNSESELALLELMDMSKKSGGNIETDFLRAKVLFGLGDVSSSRSDFITSYFGEPTSEKLTYLLLCEYNQKNIESAKFIYHQLKSAETDFYNELIILYQSYYNSGRFLVANIIPTMLAELDPAQYSSYFPKPIINILSPEKESASLESEITVVFTVQHSDDIKEVTINDSPIYQLHENSGEVESFKKDFSNKISLSAGTNSIRIKAVDVFGFSAETEISVSSLNFSHPKNLISVLVDSVDYKLLQLKNFVPQEIYRLQNTSDDLFMLITDESSDAEKNNENLFYFNLFTNQFTNSINVNEAKFISREQLSGINLDLLWNHWLQKNLNYSATLIMYVDADLEISDSGWKFKYAKESNYDLREKITQLISVASEGLVFFIAGTIDNTELFRKQMSSIIERSVVPIAFIQTEGISEELLIEHCYDPDYYGDNEIISEFYTISEITNSINKADCVFTNNTEIKLFNLPAAKIISNHRSNLTLLAEKLKAAKISKSNSNLILSYAKNWRRHIDIIRYLNDEFSLSDFLIKIEEFNNRMEGN